MGNLEIVTSFKLIKRFSGHGSLVWPSRSVCSRGNFDMTALPSSLPYPLFLKRTRLQTYNILNILFSPLAVIPTLVVPF